MLIYLAGPIRSNLFSTMDENVSSAKAIALDLWSRGYAVICPHANTDLPISLSDEKCESNVWLNGDLEMLIRCDAMVVLNGWQSSVGTLGEISFAKENNIPVYYYPDVPEISLTEKLRPVQCKSFLSIIMGMYRLHLRKNSDYSAANILGTGEIGIVVRLWDKIARLLNLSGFNVTISESSFDKPREPKLEAIDDTYIDAANYAVIGMLYRKGDWGK